MSPEPALGARTEKLKHLLLNKPEQTWPLTLRDLSRLVETENAGHPEKCRAGGFQYAVTHTLDALALCFLPSSEVTSLPGLSLEAARHSLGVQVEVSLTSETPPQSHPAFQPLFGSGPS